MRYKGEKIVKLNHSLFLGANNRGKQFSLGV